MKWQPQTQLYLLVLINLGWGEQKESQEGVEHGAVHMEMGPVAR